METSQPLNTPEVTTDIVHPSFARWMAERAATGFVEPDSFSVEEHELSRDESGILRTEDGTPVRRIGDRLYPLPQGGIAAWVNETTTTPPRSLGITGDDDWQIFKGNPAFMGSPSQASIMEYHGVLRGGTPKEAIKVGDRKIEVKPSSSNY